MRNTVSSPKVPKSLPEHKSCAICGKPIYKAVTAHYSRRRYCSQTCQTAATRKPQESSWHNQLCAGTVGAVGELVTAADLLQRGYEVFRSVSPAATCDLLISRNGHILRIEVRTGRRMARGDIAWPKANPLRADHTAVVIDGSEVQYFPELQLT